MGLLLILLGLPTQILAQEPNEAELKLELGPFQDPKKLLINLNMTDVQDLYGVEVQLKYDPTQLTIEDGDSVSDGKQLFIGSLIPSEGRLVVINSVEEETGVIKLVVTLLNPAPPVSGAGNLASMIFQVRDNNNKPIEVEVINAKLITSDLKKQPVLSYDLVIDTTNPTPQVATPQSTVDPSVTIETPSNPAGNPPPTSTAPWGWVVALLGTVVLLLIIIVLMLRTSQSEPSVGPTPVRRMPGASFSSGKSSTLLSRQGNEALAQQEFEKAYEYFSQAVELDPANAEAWLGKGLVARHETEKRICLQRVLALDPDNETAKIALQQL